MRYPLLVKGVHHGGKEAFVFMVCIFVFVCLFVLILIFCSFDWLEEEAVYYLAIYNHGYTGVHGQEGGNSNQEHLLTSRPDDSFTTMGCAV